MSKKNNTGRMKTLCAFVLAAALSCALGGCAQEKPEHPQRPNHSDFTATLPDFDAYRQEAEQLRSEQAAQTETDVLPEEAYLDDTEADSVLPDETASEDIENEDWKEGLSFPSATLAPLESEITGESAVTASDDTAAQTVAGTAAETEAQTAARTEAQTALLAQTSPGSQTISVSPAAAVNATLGLSGEASREYDKEFFASDLFIGDSISTGYSLYGFMDEKNVFAKIGLNPSSVLTKSVPTVYGEITAKEMIAYTLPKRVYIMLGSNGIQWLSGESMIKSMKTLTETIALTSPETEIVIVGVPPVTAAYDSTVDGMDVMAAVNDYNSSLSKFAAENGYIFVDPGIILKDSTGYFSLGYAEGDGMHFKSATYKVLLSYLQREVTAAEERAAAMAAAEEEAAMAAAGMGEHSTPGEPGIPGNEDDFEESPSQPEQPKDMEKAAANADSAVKNAVTGFPQEFVTLPEAVSAKAERETQIAVS